VGGDSSHAPCQAGHHDQQSKQNQCCVSKSGRIGIILTDSGPHPEPADPFADIHFKECKAKPYFFQKIQIYPVQSKVLKKL
jgi:hypothetical protein